MKRFKRHVSFFTPSGLAIVKNSAKKTSLKNEVYLL